MLVSSHEACFAERLDIVPAQFRVAVVRRPKYACRSCEDVVVQAAAPTRLIEGDPADRGDGRPSAGVEICRPPSALSPGADLCPPGRQAGSLDTGRLGWTCSIPVATDLSAAARSAERVLEAVCRRDDGGGARSRWGQDRNRSALHLRWG